MWCPEHCLDVLESTPSPVGDWVQELFSESLESAVIGQFGAFYLKVNKVKKQMGLPLFRVNF